MQSIKTIITVVLSWMAITVIAQKPQQEVVIIGTMHTVPGIIGRAYKPMLNKAIKYQPQDIYVERQPAWDTVSVKNYFPEFFAKADSLSKTMSFEESEMARLLSKATADLSKKEADRLRLYYYTKLDYANMEFYRRVARYGVDGYDKPSRNENGDLTFPLAIAMGIRNIKSMDNQTYYTEYGKTWKGCDIASKQDGEYELLKKKLSKFMWRNYTGILAMGSSGRITNKPKNTALLQDINSMEYRETNNEVCDEANYYWDYRNQQMVRNTAEQILRSGNVRSVVVVGAGHVEGILDYFAKDYPQIKVIRYEDMPDNRGTISLADGMSKALTVGAE